MKNPIYLDYAATTPVDSAVLDAMLPYFGSPQASQSFPRATSHEPRARLFGNPSSLHSFGQQASGTVFIARQMIAKELNCHYPEIVFTGSATEANNLALRGALRSMNYEVRSKEGKSQKPLIHNSNFIIQPRIIISSIEHESVLETAKDLEKEGCEVVYIPVSKEGIVDMRKLKAALNERTALVSVMLANNEVGVVQPLEQIAKLVRDFRATSHALRATRWPLLHTDAAQAFQYMECNVQKLGVDLLTLSAHKIYGPKGIGALYVRQRRMAHSTKQMDGQDSFDYEPRATSHVPIIDSIITGGGQEQWLRSGTENVPYIVGFAKAIGLAAMDREDEGARVAKLRDEAWRGVKKVFPKTILNGPTLNIPTFSRMLECRRLPNNLNFYIPNVSGEQLLVALDLHGVAVSSGSACVARSADASHVLLAMGCNEQRAKNSIRVSLGRPTSKADIAGFLGALKKSKATLD